MADLSKMEFKTLREMARGLGINPSQKDRANLIREIEKAQKVKAGKGTPADPKAGQKAGAAKAPRNETGEARAAAKPREAEEDEEEEEAKPSSAAREAKPAPKERDESAEKIAALEAKVTELSETSDAYGSVIVNLAKFAANLANEIGVEVPEEVKPLLVISDEDDEEDGGTTEDDAEVEDEDEEDADEEEEETLDISAKELEEATPERLHEIATAINESGKGEIKIVKSARLMRDAIRDFLNKNAEVTATEEPTSKKTGPVPQQKKLEVPDGFRVGSKVEVNFGDDGWQPGAITVIDDVKGTCDVTLDNGEECEAEWSEMRVANTTPKKRVVKKS